MRRLAGAEFHVKRIEVDEIFRDLHYDDTALYFGPALSGLVLQQYRDFIQSPMAFAWTLKVLLYLEHVNAR